MAERDELIANLRQLIELDRGFGIEFLALPVASPPSPRQARATDPAAPVTVAAPRPLPLRAAQPARAPVQTAAPAVEVQPWAPPADLLTAAAGDALARIAAEVATCRRCGLCATRTTTVPGEGAPAPELLFIGEGPGAEEDKAGRPFVGAAGQLLDKMIAAMGLRRGDVFIANVVKCRPPGNRTPEPAEIERCLPFLQVQIAVLKPRIICTLGNVPLQALFGATVPGITRSRGQRMTWQGITVIPTFHPSYLLRNPAAKKPCWEDLQAVLAELGRTPPARA